MNIEIINATETKTTVWSGGITNEIFIYPKESNFLKRDFFYRISVASVDVEESIFTNLTGIKRVIMPLSGNLKLVHEGHYEVLLKPFENDAFKGDWTTKSYGKVTDFNLMTKDNYFGELTHHFVDNICKKISLTKKHELFYVASGILFIDEIEIKKGGLIKFEDTFQNICIKGKNADIIQVSVGLS